MSGAHRDVVPPWLLRVRCWALGHAPVPEGNRVRCTRCQRTANTPVEL